MGLGWKTGRQVKMVTDLIRAHGGRIASILSGYGGAPESFLRVYIRTREVAALKQPSGRTWKGKQLSYDIHEKLD